MLETGATSQPRKIRVLIVDDSVVVRHMLAEICKADPEIEIVGMAPNGRQGVAMFEQLKPDVVTLDIEMPEMTGLEALIKIREKDARVPVIMFSSLTMKGASDTLEALGKGATDYITKPTNSLGGLMDAKEWVREQMLQKIKALGGRFAISAPPIKIVERASGSLAMKSRVDIVAIGISTGGPNALMQMIPTLKADIQVPIVIVQHMPETFTKSLADRLAKTSALQVREGENGALVEPGTVWIAPGGHHMVLRRDGDGVRLAINDRPPENSCRPSVDVMFRSVVDLFGARILGVIMTGMGSDGLKGCDAIRKAGGQIVVQDEATSVVWGMPGFVARAGLADKVLPLDRIGSEITERVAFRRC